VARRRRRHERGFKLAAIARLETASDVRDLAFELGVNPGLLYKWQQTYRRGGAAALRLPGERALADGAVPQTPVLDGATEAPATSGSMLPSPEVAALDLDFLHAALQHFAGRRRRTGGSGGTGSLCRDPGTDPAARDDRDRERMCYLAAVSRAGYYRH
jgi:transposase-like protein